MTGTKAAVGALLGGLGGVTLAILGKAFFTRERNPEAFDAVTSAGALLGAVVGASLTDVVAPPTGVGRPQLPPTA